MAKTAALVIKMTSDTGDAVRGMTAVEKKSAGFQRGMEKANRAAIAVAAGLTAVGVASFNEASKLEQAAGAVEAVFGKQARAVHALGKSAADTLGLSRSEYEQTAAVFGAQLKNMGVAAQDLVPTTDKLVALGGDLAATFGGSTTEAVEALSSLLRGERDPIERYGVSIKQADINARLAAQGQSKLTGEAKKAAEAEATMALLYEQTANAQGQRARESETAAVKQERAMAKLKNAAAAFGAVLLPIVSAAATGLGNLAGYAEKNATTFQILATVLGAVAAAVIAVNAAIKVWRATVAVATAAQWAWNAAMAANPVGLVILAVAALIAGIVLLYRKSSAFRSLVQAVGRVASTAFKQIVAVVRDLATWVGPRLSAAFRVLKTVATVYLRIITAPLRLIINLLTVLLNWVAKYLPAGFAAMSRAAVAAFKAITAPIRAAVGWVQSLVSALRNIKWPSPPKWLSSAAGAVGGLFRAAPSGGASYATVRASGVARGGSGYRTSRVGGSSGEGGITINVSGALDPVQVGNQIAELLRRRSLRLGVRT